MQVLVLPGNHPSVREWAERLATELASSFERAHVQGYEHWETGRERIDFDRELRRLPSFEAPFAVIGKSAGAALALLALDRGRLRPVRLVSIGLPLRYARAVHVDLAGPIARLAVPTLLIQQTADPGATFSEVAALGASSTLCTAVEVPGDDHRYDDVQELLRIIAGWAFEARGS